MKSIAHACLLGAAFCVVSGVLGTSRLCVSSAAAQRGREQAGEQSPEYRRLVQQALDEFQRGNWDEAAGLFAQAHTLSPSARTLRGMGLAAFEGRRYVDALRDLRAALESTVNPLTAEQRAEVSETVSRAEHYVAQLELSVTPADAEVRVNGVVVPDQGGTRALVVDPGLIEVRASAPGYEPEARELRMVSGARQTVAVQLARIGEGKTSSTLVGPSTPPPRETRRSGPPFGTLAWLSVGLAGAGGVAAVVAWQVREGAADEFNDAKCREDGVAASEVCADSLARVNSAETGIIVSAVAGGAFLAAGVVFFLLDSDQNSVEAAQSCGAGPGDLGLSCRLKF